MSATEQSQLDRKAALDRLKFQRKKGPSKQQTATVIATTPSSSSSLSSASSLSVSPWAAPPAQSRDGSSSRQSRFFAPASNARGTVLVPNSSPISISSSSSPSNGFRRPPQPPPRARPPLSSDPVAGPSNFTLPSFISRPSFATPIEISSSPPSYPKLASPPLPPAITSPVASPGSPEIQRLGQRRRAAAPSHKPNLSISSDDSLPQPLVRPEQSSRPPSSTKGTAVTADGPKYTLFRLTFAEYEAAKSAAAWVQSDGDEKRAEQLLKDPTWIWKPASSTKAPPSGSGRAREAEEKHKAQRDAGKERAKKSMIYAARVELEKRDASPPPSQARATSPVSPEVGPRRPKRGRAALESDDESDDVPTPTSDAGPSRLKKRIISDEEGEKPSPKPVATPKPASRAPKSDAQAALDYFNQQGVDALRELTGCTEAQAEKIIELRPYESVADLKERLGQGKKKAGPLKISPRMFEDCVETFEGYSAVDDVLEQCESIGAALQAHIARWQGPPKGKGRSLNPDVWEDGALSLRSVAGGAAKDFLSRQPASMASSLELKEYQLLGLNWLRLMHMKGHSGILADEMGLGKTVQVISFLAHLHETGNRGPHLIVVPSSTLENWVREFRKFAPAVKVQTYYGKKDERPELRARLLETMRSRHPGGWEVLITTYTLASGDERDRKFMRKVDWEACVFDEGHMLKNYQSNVYRALIKCGTRWKLLLTGTPLQNNLQELVSLMNFILPKILGPEMDALRAVFKTKGDSKVTLLAKERVERAKRMMTPFVLRRRKEQVLKDLPEKHERIEWCEMTPLQRQLYDEALARSRKTVVDIDPATPDESQPVKKMPRAKEKRYLENSANVLMDLRKAASHTMLFRTRFTDRVLTQVARLLAKEDEWKKYTPADVKEELEHMSDMDIQRTCYSYNSTQQYLQDAKCYYDTGKITVLLKLLDRYIAEGRKVLLFSQFVQNLDILIAMLDHRNIRHLVLTGQTPVDQRQALVDEFTEDETIPLFLLSTKAGGMGINLTAASVVILFDQDFNPHNDRQAQDRAYRIGQKRTVDVIKLITRDSVEEDMLRLGQTKLALDAAVAGDGEAAENVERQLKTSLMSMLRKQAGGESQTQAQTQAQIPAPAQTRARARVQSDAESAMEIDDSDDE